ncbi:MAG: hypothetical protein M1300_02730 [Epsilonproteobacteria bacterium]|nr:hypothetical protein [Campylobacterota bacterium]
MQEHWIRYTTDKLFEKKYYFDSLEYQDKTLTIILNDPEIDSTYVYITFQDSVEGFRNTNESYAYQVIDILTDLYGADFYGDRTFFNIFHLTKKYYIASLVDDMNGCKVSLISTQSILSLKMDIIQEK